MNIKETKTEELYQLYTELTMQIEQGQSQLQQMAQNRAIIQQEIVERKKVVPTPIEEEEEITE